MKYALGAEEKRAARELRADSTLSPTLRRDKYEHTPLHYASKKASADVIKVLVVAGADIGARDDEEKTPLHKVFN